MRYKFFLLMIFVVLLSTACANRSESLNQQNDQNMLQTDETGSQPDGDNTRLTKEENLNEGRIQYTSGKCTDSGDCDCGGFSDSSGAVTSNIEFSDDGVIVDNIFYKRVGKNRYQSPDEIENDDGILLRGSIVFTEEGALSIVEKDGEDCLIIEMLIAKKDQPESVRITP